MLTSLRNRTASPAVVYFAFSRLVLLMAVLTAYHAARPLESVAKTSRAVPNSQRVHPTRAAKALPIPDRRTYAEHVANIALQSARIADLQNEEQELPCEALVSASCDDMADARCVETVQQCRSLGALHDQIVEERRTVEAVFELGFIEFETICDRIVARDGQLTFEQSEWRRAFRTALLEHLDALSGLLRERSEILKPLRTAAQELGGETLLEALEIPRRHDATRAAADSILESAQAIRLGAPRDRRHAPDMQPAYDPRIPPCGGDVQCWKI